MENVIDISKFKKKPLNSTKPDFTPEEIQAKIQPYLDWVNQPTEVFGSKSGDKWTKEEIDQLKRLIFRYTCECMSCNYQAKELKKYYPWRSENSLLKKISEIRQVHYQEIENFYGIVACGGIVVRDAQCNYSLATGKINFGNYLHYRILQMVGLIDEPGGKKNTEVKEYVDEEDEIQTRAIWTVIFKKERKYYKEISIKEAVEELLTTPDTIEPIVRELLITKLNTKHLFDIAMKLENNVGQAVRDFSRLDKDMLARRIRAAKWAAKLK